MLRHFWRVDSADLLDAFMDTAIPFLSHSEDSQGSCGSVFYSPGGGFTTGGRRASDGGGFTTGERRASNGGGFTTGGRGRRTSGFTTGGRRAFAPAN